MTDDSKLHNSKRIHNYYEVMEMNKLPEDILDLILSTLSSRDQCNFYQTKKEYSEHLKMSYAKYLLEEISKTTQYPQDDYIFILIENLDQTRISLEALNAHLIKMEKFPNTLKALLEEAIPNFLRKAQRTIDAIFPSSMNENLIEMSSILHWQATRVQETRKALQNVILTMTYKSVFDN